MPYYWDYALIITAIALLIDFKFGEFPIKHPVEYFGDFIKWYIKNFYRDSVISGAILTLIMAVTITGLAFILEYSIFYASKIFHIPNFIGLIIIGIIASTGLSSKCLKDYVKKVIYTDDPTEKRENLAFLVTRNTMEMDDNKVYSSTIETHSENLCDGVIAPLIFLALLGLPGIAFFKVISTLDSMIGYKNDKYYNFGKVAALADDFLNIIPSRLTAILIWYVSKCKYSLSEIFQDAPKYSSSPNSGCPVSSAAYALGIKIGGTVFYGTQEVSKGIIGPALSNDYKQAAIDFVKIHQDIEQFIITCTLFIMVIRFYTVLY